jgi:hypothetical protein
MPAHHEQVTGEHQDNKYSERNPGADPESWKDEYQGYRD